MLFPDGEAEVFEHFYRAGLAALEVSGVKVFAGGEFIGRAENRLVVGNGIRLFWTRS